MTAAIDRAVDATKYIDVFVGFRDEAGDDAAAYGTITTDDRETLARTALTAALDVNEVWQILEEHRPSPATSPYCACGWRPSFSLNDTESDRSTHRAHQAEALIAHMLGAG